MRAKVGGMMRTVFSIAVMERETGKSLHTLRRWERNKVIPKSTYRDKLKRRYYLKEEIEKLADLITKFGLEGQGRKPPEEFTKEVKKWWKHYRGEKSVKKTKRKTKRKPGSKKEEHQESVG